MPDKTPQKKITPAQWYGTDKGLGYANSDPYGRYMMLMKAMAENNLGGYVTPSMIVGDKLPTDAPAVPGFGRISPQQEAARAVGQVINDPLHRYGSESTQVKVQPEPMSYMDMVMAKYRKSNTKK